MFHIVEHVSAKKDEATELTEGLVKVVEDVMGNLTDADMGKILSGGDD